MPAQRPDQAGPGGRLADTQSLHHPQFPLRLRGGLHRQAGEPAHCDQQCGRRGRGHPKQRHEDVEEHLAESVLVVDHTEHLPARRRVITHPRTHNTSHMYPSPHAALISPLTRQ